MMRTAACVATLAALVAGCGDPAPSPNGGQVALDANVTGNIATGSIAREATPPRSSEAHRVPSERIRHDAPAVAMPEPPAGEEQTAGAAADVMRRYYAALDRRRYSEAHALWDAGSAPADADAFARGFARYASYHAEIGPPGRVDAGAGQRYVTVPVRAYGDLRAGGTFALTGSATLHRTGDIDGATPDQRRWHIRAIDLKPDARGGHAAAGDHVTARYRCVDGTRFVVDFDNDRNIATLRSGDRRLGVLAARRAASGIWYDGDGLELRGKGREATLVRPGRPPVACQADR